MNATEPFFATGDSFPTLPGVNPAWIRSQLIGHDATAQAPFGERRIVYADYVASWRSLQWIENFILKQVLPLYANTHTEDSVTGALMTSLAHDAAKYIKQCLGAQNGKLLFCGTGSTAAIKRLQEILGLIVPENLRARVIATLGPTERPIVFVGSYEHHSNEVSWRETIAEVIELPLNADGAIDLNLIRIALGVVRNTGRPLFGSFSAASNITGVLTLPIHAPSRVCCTSMARWRSSILPPQRHTRQSTCELASPTARFSSPAALTRAASRRRSGSCGSSPTVAPTLPSAS